VPPGDYQAVATKEGYLRGTAVAAGGDVPIGAGGSVEVRGGGPAKGSFLGGGGTDPRFGPDPTENERNGVQGLLLSADGTGKAALKPGTYDVVVSRGPEYELERSQIVVPPGGSAMVSAGLRRVVDTTGWISGDYHQHCQ